MPVTCKLQPQLRFVWDVNSANDFVRLLCDDMSRTLFQQFENEINLDINDTIEILNNILYRAGDSMKRVSRVNRKVGTVNQMRQPDWWDRDCDIKKCKKYDMLTKYRVTNCCDNLRKYLDEKNEFKKLCRIKQGQAKSELQNSVDNPVKFWSKVKKMGTKTPIKSSISAPQWVDHFNKLLNQPSSLDKEFEKTVKNYIRQHDSECNTCMGNVVSNSGLDAKITVEEVINVISELSNGKSPGEDGILNIMLKSAREVIVPYLVILFNKILDSGQYPERWSDAVLFPLHKKGSATDKNNFRGISLLSVVGKIFTKKLNERLIKWANDHNAQHDEQAGYKKGYSTIDNIFVLQSIIQKYLSRQKGRYYVLFIDVSKAFDTIPHALSWYKMQSCGIHGKILVLLRNMYSQLKSCVRTEDWLTDYFKCTIGTRQGCILGPFLFALYIGELVDMMKDKGCKGVYINEEVPNLMIILYADDIAECSDTVGRLQFMINVLVEYCRMWSLIVNLCKTKIVVFRRGGKLKRSEKWYFNGKKMDVVSSYKYLGIIFSTKLKWTLAKKTLAAQARKAIGLIFRYHYQCCYLPV